MILTTKNLKTLQHPLKLKQQPNFYIYLHIFANKKFILKILNFYVLRADFHLNNF